MADYRYERTDWDIQNTFIRLLQTDGFESLTVSKLAKESLIDRSTFYAHYNSVYELAAAAIATQIQVIPKALIASKNIQANERYQLFSDELTAYLIANVSTIAEIRLIPLGTNIFDSQCRKLFTDFYLQMLDTKRDSFICYLFVNMVLSDLDFILVHRRAPMLSELRSSLQEVTNILR